MISIFLKTKNKNPPKTQYINFPKTFRTFQTISIFLKTLCTSQMISIFSKQPIQLKFYQIF